MESLCKQIRGQGGVSQMLMGRGGVNENITDYVDMGRGLQKLLMKRFPIMLKSGEVFKIFICFSLKAWYV